MARHNKQPPMLDKVLKTMRHLKASRGVTASKIISHLRSTNTSPVTRNTTFRIRRALRTGIKTGDLKQQAGRYKLEKKKALPSKRRFSVFDDVSVKKGNRSKYTKPAKQDKGKKRRRSPSSSSTLTEETTDRSTSETSHSETPDDASCAYSKSRTADRERYSERRRPKTFKRLKKRQPSRNNSQQRRSETPDRDKISPQLEPEINSEPKQVEIDKKASMISNRSKIRHSRHNEAGLHDSERPSYHCGNEDCLCNYKKDAKELKGDSSQSEGPADDYIC